MGVHSLVTGLNGAGKTLYIVGDKLRKLVGATVEVNGVQVRRRLVQGGVRDLLLEHELMDVPELNPETFKDDWASVTREPGAPPVLEHNGQPVVWSILNWWLWCQPGDVIFVDEAQRVFRPMPAGRRVPMFLSKLETARHYGVEFLYATQHPQLLHTNLRNLVGPHEDIRRIFGGKRAMVYLWDRCSSPDRISKATARVWKHDRSVFSLYKSAELHHKFGERLPYAVWLALFSVIALCVMGWMLRSRLTTQFFGVPASAVVGAASAPSAGAGGSLLAAGSAGAPGPSAGSHGGGRWPMYEAVPFKVDREPLSGRAVQLEGSYTFGGKTFARFGLLVDGERVASASLEQMTRMGYAFTELGPCVGSLRWNDLERLITCGKSAGAPSLVASSYQAGTGAEPQVVNPRESR